MYLCSIYLGLNWARSYIGTFRPKYMLFWHMDTETPKPLKEALKGTLKRARKRTLKGVHGAL